MGLTPLEISAFKLFNSLYRHMYKFPIEWNEEFTQLRLVKPLFPTLLPYFFIVIMNIFMSLAGFGVAIFFNKLQLDLRVRPVDALVLTIAAYATALVFLGVPTMIKMFFGVNISILMEEFLLIGMVLHWNCVLE